MKVTPKKKLKTKLEFTSTLRDKKMNFYQNKYINLSFHSFVK